MIPDDVLALEVERRAVCPFCAAVGLHPTTFEFSSAPMPKTLRRCRDCGGIFSILSGLGRRLSDAEDRALTLLFDRYRDAA